MTLTDTKIYVSILICGLLSACASTPPPRIALDRAQDAIAEANGMRASDYAPVEFDAAVAQMREAEALYARRDAGNADAAASQAEVNAELAIAKSRAARARATVQSKTEENARLRNELLGEHGGVR